MPVQVIGDAECRRKRERPFRSSLISEAAFGPCAFDQGVCIPQQHLNGRLRRDLVGTGFQHEHPLLVAQSNECDRQPLPLGKALGFVPGIRRGNPGLVWFDDLLDRALSDTVVLPHVAHRIGNFGISHCQNPVTEDLIAGRKAVKAEHGDHQTQRRAVDE